MERLETSRLYQQREQAARDTRARTKVAALWYCDPKFKPRYEEFR
jgi:hypothetical protein